MATIKHETWTRENGDKFVMLPVKEYRRLEELAEDAGLSRIMKESKNTPGRPAKNLAGGSETPTGHDQKAAKNQGIIVLLLDRVACHYTRPV